MMMRRLVHHTSKRMLAAASGPHAKDHKGFAAREDAVENKYFNQQDKLALESLLKKLKHHTEPENQVHHTATLEEIFEYHGVPLSNDLRKDLLAWKEMHRFLGKKKPEAPTPTLDDASKGIDTRGDEIDVKIKKLDAELADLKKKMNMSRSEAAKANFKRRAVQVLKQRKMYEKQREHLYGQQMNIDQAKFATQSVKDNATMVAAMKSTAKELKKAYKDINISEVENLHDEMSDLMDMSEEVNQLMGTTYGVPEDVDEDELLDELDALDDDIELADSEQVPSYLVDAPKAGSKPRKVADEEVDELGLPTQLKV